MIEHIISKHIGYCGLVCSVCSISHQGCKGCKNKGGDSKCYQRKCCLEKGIDGCWECESSPCENGYFGMVEWKGLYRGLINKIKEKNNCILCYLCIIKLRFGPSIDFGKLRYLHHDQISDILDGK